jgi:hypothetical protein
MATVSFLPGAYSENFCNSISIALTDVVMNFHNTNSDFWQGCITVYDDMNTSLSLDGADKQPS